LPQVKKWEEGEGRVREGKFFLALDVPPMSSPSKLLHRSCKVFNYMQREELCRNLF
jgi:hypothetical protein